MVYWQSGLGPFAGFTLGGLALHTTGVLGSADFARSAGKNAPDPARQALRGPMICSGATAAFFYGHPARWFSRSGCLTASTVWGKQVFRMARVLGCCWRWRFGADADVTLSLFSCSPEPEA